MSVNVVFEWFKEFFQSPAADAALPGMPAALAEDATRFDEQRKLRSLGEVYEQILQLDLPQPNRAMWNLMRGIYFWVDIGDGVKARQHFQQAYDLAQASNHSPGVNVEKVAADSAVNMMLLSLSFDECTQWADRLRILAPHEEVLHEQWSIVKQSVKDGHPWADAMMIIAGSYFNPDPRKDPAIYGPAASVLQLMLTNRKALRLARERYWSCAGTYSSLVLKMWHVAAQVQTLKMKSLFPGELSLLFDSAIPLVKEAAKANPNDPQLAECVEQLERCAKVSRHDVVALTDAGSHSTQVCANAAKDRTVAIQNAGRSPGPQPTGGVLELGPKSAQVWSNNGVALAASGRLSEALACFKHALAQDPHNADLWYNMGVLFGDQRQYAEAIDCYDRALAINQSDPKTWLNKAFALGEMGGQTAKELECYDCALKIDPKYSRAWFDKGATLANVERWREALVCFQEAERLGNTGAPQAIATCLQMLRK